MKKNNLDEDYFELFNIEKKFDIDEKILENNYIALQSICHPDKFFTQKEKQIAFEQSQLINNAYSILKSPIDRAEYLLTFVYNEKNFIPSEEVLSELFELQEKIFDSYNDTKFITSLINQHIKNLYKSFNEMNIFLAQKSVLFVKYLLKLK